MYDFLAIKLRKMDVILGVQWLLTTRFMESMTMTFLASENQVMLKGDPTLTKRSTLLKCFLKYGKRRSRFSN